MQLLNFDQLSTVTGGASAGAQVARRIAKRAAGAALPLYNAYSAVQDAHEAYSDARKAGDGKVVSTLKGAGAAAEGLTWPLVPLAREAVRVDPAY